MTILPHSHLILLPVAFLMTCTLSSCATWVVRNPRKTITLEEATKSLGRSLVEMKRAQIAANNNQDFRTGLVPAEAEVTFKVAASGSNSSELTVDLSPNEGLIPFTGKFFGKFAAARAADRSNTVTIKFKNIVFEDTNQNLTATINAMEGTGISPSVTQKAPSGGMPTTRPPIQIYQEQAPR